MWCIGQPCRQIQYMSSMSWRECGSSEGVIIGLYWVKCSQLSLSFSAFYSPKSPLSLRRQPLGFKWVIVLVQSVWTRGDHLWPVPGSRRDCYDLRICGSDEHFKHLSVKFWILIMTIKCTVHWIDLKWITPMVAYGTFQENGLILKKLEIQKSKISKYTLTEINMHFFKRKEKNNNNNN